MARPHKPLNVLRMNGTAKNHPARLKKRENEPENVKPLPDPPTHLSKHDKAAYKEIVELSIPGVLGEADTLAVEQAASLLVPIASKKKASLVATTHYCVAIS